MRAFFCLELKPDLREKLAGIAKRLRAVPVKARWVPSENLHVTLVFLGDIAPDAIPDLEVAAREAVAKSRVDDALEWELDRLGAFPHLSAPRVVWVGCSEEPERVRRLAEALERALEPLGFEPEGREFTTHVTLGRVKGRGRASGVDRLAEALVSHPSLSVRARATELTLMESTLAPQGASYEPVFRIPFSEDER